MQQWEKNFIESSSGVALTLTVTKKQAGALAELYYGAQFGYGIIGPDLRRLQELEAKGLTKRNPRPYVKKDPHWHQFVVTPAGVSVLDLLVIAHAVPDAQSARLYYTYKRPEEVA